MSDPVPEAPVLPRPFYGRPWPRRLRDDARALWDWHAALARADVPALDGRDLTAFFEAERESAEAGEPLRSMPEETARRAYRACADHELPHELLVVQILPARRLKEPPLRFATAAELDGFIRNWATPLATLLARLAGAGHSWQERSLHELTRGFFLTGRLVRLPQDLAHDRLFIPETDLEQTGVAVEQLRRGEVDEHLRRLFWKQAVRIRDALAQGQALTGELPRRYASALKRYWLGALDVLDEIERRDYDLWSRPIRLSGFRRLQVRLQAFFGRAASS